MEKNIEIKFSQKLFESLKQLITEMKHKILNIKEESYSSKLDIESLKNKIEKLYKQKNLRLSGRVINKDEFTVYDKLVVVGWNMPNLRRKSAYVKGKIITKEKGTILKLTIKPNSILPLFAVFSFFVGIIITIISFLENKFYLTFGLTFIALGVLYYPLSIFLRNRLENKIVKYLDLDKN